MKNLPFLTLLSLLLLCFTACDKDGLSSHRIIDAATKEGIPNATVELYESTGGGIIGGGTAVFRERTTTNDLGEYSFEYDTKSGTRFRISAGADRYWNSTNNIYPENKTLELDPEGYVKVKVMKVDTVEYASIFFNTISTSLGNIQFAGNKIDTSFIDIYRGGKYNNLVWWITINNEEERTIGEDIYFPSHDTTTFEIIF